MTFLGLEQPVAYGRELVFDPTTALMVLNANRDYINAVYRDYQLAMADMKEFNEKYGDFTSPILADMDWYYNNVTGRVKNFINDLYTRGVDPLRSQEGRAAIARELATMPTKGIAEVKLSAETAREYLKSIGDDTNPELEKFLGRDLSTWNTMGDPENGIAPNGIWKYNKAAKFQDLNSWTHHLFDDMELSYDPEESKKYPGYKVYTKSKDTMKAILDTLIAQLVSTDLGKFYLNKVKNSIPEDTPNRDKVALEELERLILLNQLENRQVKLETDPYALARYLNSLRGSSGGGGGHKDVNPKMSFNYMNGLFLRGLTSAFGYDPTTGEEHAINNIMSDQIGFGQAHRAGVFSGPWAAYKAQSDAYINQYTIQENPMMFAGIIGRKMNNEGGIPLTRADLDNLRTQADVVTSTYGYPYAHISTNKDRIKKTFDSVPVWPRVEKDGESEETLYDGIEMVPYTDVYTSYLRFGKDGAMDQQWKVAIIDKYNGKHMGDYWYTIPNTREYNSNIPGIGEWTKDKDGKYTISGDRGLAKAGINSKIRGANERASWITTGMFGVTSLPFNRDVTYNQEGVSLSPYR